MNDACLPSEEDAGAIVRGILGWKISSIGRFRAGYCHYVFNVVSTSEQRAVVRIALPQTRHYLEGAVTWSGELRPKGVPLPAILHADLDQNTSPFPYLILERLPGRDLLDVYRDLTCRQKEELAEKIICIQTAASRLPPGDGFGEVFSRAASFPFVSWTDVLLASLEKSRQRFTAIGSPHLAYADQLTGAIQPLQGYFSTVKPVAYLDDITTKNVIVHAGQLSGIVDVDFMSYGDSLRTVALTQTSLLGSGDDLDYVRAWTQRLELKAPQKKALHFYTAIYCLDLLSEDGQQFNHAAPVRLAPDRVERLESFIQRSLGSGRLD